MACCGSITKTVCSSSDSLAVWKMLRGSHFGKEAGWHLGQLGTSCVFVCYRDNSSIEECSQSRTWKVNRTYSNLLKLNWCEFSLVKGIAHPEGMRGASPCELKLQILNKQVWGQLSQQVVIQSFSGFTVLYHEKLKGSCSETQTWDCRNRTWQHPSR